MINFIVIDNLEVGLEFIKVVGFWGYDGFLVKDCFVVGYSVISENFLVCIMGGFVVFMFFCFIVFNIMFVNFDVGLCVVLCVCFFCREREGGYIIRFEKF